MQSYETDAEEETLTALNQRLTVFYSINVVVMRSQGSGVGR